MKKGFWAVFLLVIFGAVAALFKTITLFKNISFKIVSLDTPQVRSGNIIFPVNVQFNNAGHESLTVDDILNDIYLYRGGGWVKLGTSQPRLQPIVIAARQRTSTKIFPEISAAIVLRELGQTVLSSLLSLDIAPLLRENFKIDSRIIIGGRELARDEKIIGNPQNISGWLS